MPGQGQIEDDHLLLAGQDDAWKEFDDEEFKRYSGSARDFFYKGEGRLIPQRMLSALAVLDQERLSGVDLQSIRSKQETRQQGDFDCPQLPHGFTQYNPLQPDGRHVFQGLFEPLSSDGSVRFLEIAPGREGPIICRFFVANISEFRFKYEAISCSSQDDKTFPDTRVERIYCNEIGVSCNSHITGILHRLRLPDRSRIIWVAPLCIHSADLDERNYHVRQTSSIFKNAHRVIVWLGNGTEADSTAQLGSVCSVVNTWRRRRGYEEWYQEAKPINQAHPSAATSLHEASVLGSSEAWNYAVWFFERDWFISVWSLQEVSMARSAVVLYGHCMVPWDCIGLAAAIMRENTARVKSIQTSDPSYGKRPLVSTGVLHAYLMYRISLSQQYFDPLKLTFHELLALTRSFRCKFEQDKVYALLGTPGQDTMASEMAPDYARSAAQVNQDIGLLLLQSSNSLDLLTQVQHDHDCRFTMPGIRGRRNLTLRGPSWIPEWGQTIAEPISPLQKCAAFSSATAVSPQFRIGPDGARIAVLGIVVDTVTESRELRLFDSFWRGRDDSRSIPGLFAALPAGSRAEILEDLLNTAVPTLEELKSLALTLTCGKDWDGFPVSNSARHIADYARCLIRDGLWWSLRWLNNVKSLRSTDGPKDDQNKPITVEALTQLSLEGNADRFLDAARTSGTGRAEFTTRLGLWGIGQDATCQDDVLCVIYGSDVPFILRPHGQGQYHLVGECYVEEIMHGEVLEKRQQTDNRFGEAWITLV